MKKEVIIYSQDIVKLTQQGIPIISILSDKLSIEKKDLLSYIKEGKVTLTINQ